MTERSQIVQMLLPWFDTSGELEYSSMSVSSPGTVDRRAVFKAVRKWYKSAIGVTVCKVTLTRIWKRRHTTYAISEQDIMQKLHNMARDTYEENKESTDTCSEAAPAGEAEL